MTEIGSEQNNFLVCLWGGRLPVVMAVGSWWEYLKVLEEGQEEEEKRRWLESEIKEEKEEEQNLTFTFILGFNRMLVTMNRRGNRHVIFVITVLLIIYSIFVSENAKLVKV